MFKNFTINDIRMLRLLSELLEENVEYTEHVSDVEERGIGTTLAPEDDLIPP